MRGPQEEFKRSQKQLVAQLQQQLQASLGPPLHTCLGQAFVALYSVGDTFSMHESLGKCCDIIKMKEDAAAGPSNTKLYVISVRLCTFQSFFSDVYRAAIECLGAIFQQHGRMVRIQG